MGNGYPKLEYREKKYNNICKDGDISKFYKNLLSFLQLAKDILII